VSRQIDLTEPLSDEDRLYLRDRSRFDLIAAADAIAAGEEYSDSMFTQGNPAVQSGEELPPNTGTASSHYDPPEYGGGTRVELDDSEDDEEPDYDSWKKSELEAEAHNRGLEKSGTKADIAERLRQHDAGDEPEDDES
jgi:hypothetical protein